MKALTNRLLAFAAAANAFFFAAASDNPDLISAFSFAAADGDAHLASANGLAAAATEAGGGADFIRSLFGRRRQSR